MKTKIFCDSADFTTIKKFNKNPLVSGFTTNPSLMRKAGAKDYSKYCKNILKITKKPISFEVFADDNKNIIKHGKLVLDASQLECEWDGKFLPEKLTTTEFLIVKELAKRPGIIKERAQLMDIAYKDNNDIEDRTIDSHVKRIRKKFKKVDPNFSAIETRYGSGYRWNVS